MTPRHPVEGFPIRFNWQDEWVRLFDKQVELLKSDINRARAEDRVIVYLSCPISSRGGGYKGTNVDIAKHTQRRLMADWGHRFWILNPAQYQMESKEGTGLFKQHATALNMTEEKVDQLLQQHRPGGGDYMRMWTRVLVEDGVDNSGQYFDAFYFLSPTDVRDFFSRGGAVTVTAGIEEYFARKFSMDPDFRDTYSRSAIEWDKRWTDPGNTRPVDQREAVRDWEAARKDFFRFYSVRASANFSLGCHDEWNILRLLNQIRLDKTKDERHPGGDAGGLIAGFFEGRQIAPGAAVTAVSAGYAFD